MVGARRDPDAICADRAGHAGESSSCGRWRRDQTRRRTGLEVPELDQSPDLRAASCWPTSCADWIRDADRRIDVSLESKGTALAARRRADPGAPARRVRPGDRARAESARRAGGRSRPHGADRAPAVQDLMALADALATAAGRPDLRLPADQPARWPGRRPTDGTGDRPHGPLWETLRERAAEHPSWQSRVRSYSARCWTGSTTYRRYALFAETLGPLGGRAGCSRAWGRRQRSRSTNCSTRR